MYMSSPPPFTTSLPPPSVPPPPSPHPTSTFCTDTIYIPGHNSSHTEYPGTLPVTHLWTVVDCILVVVIVFGNSLTIAAVRTNRRLSNVLSNQFILNLAMSDLFLGLTLPYHMAFYLCAGLGHHEVTCLLRFVIISFACTSSVYNLIAIAVDRYIAIVHPLHYCQYMTERKMCIIVCCGWLLALVISTVSIYWNTWDDAVVCELDEVLAKGYLSLVLLPAFLLIWVAMFVFYVKIWRAAAGQAKRMREAQCCAAEGVSDKKSIQVVLLILGCFSLCWFPFFTVAIARSYDLMRTQPAILIYKATFSLAMANSGMNPIIYAWKNSEFRATFARLLRCKSGGADREPFKPFKLRNTASVCSDSAKSRCSSNEGDVATGGLDVANEVATEPNGLKTKPNGLGMAREAATGLNGVATEPNGLREVANGVAKDSNGLKEATTVPQEIVMVPDEGAIVARRGDSVSQTEL